MTSELNLEELERLLKEATPLPWIQFGGSIRDNSESRVLICSGVHCKIDVATRDHALIAAAVNALPELIRRVREAEEDARRYRCLKAQPTSIVNEFAVSAVGYWDGRIDEEISQEKNK